MVDGNGLLVINLQATNAGPYLWVSSSQMNDFASSPPVTHEITYSNLDGDEVVTRPRAAYNLGLNAAQFRAASQYGKRA